MSFPDRDLLARHLDGIGYPCGRQELLRHAAAGGGGDAILGALGGLPQAGRYDDLDSVWTALECHRTGESS